MKSNMACPKCMKNMEFIGCCGIVDWDSQWQAEVERFQCDNCDKTVLITETGSLDPQTAEE